MWDYSNTTQTRYGDDDLSYAKAAEFLNDGPVEDWGCGTAYAKRFFTQSYTGVDQAPGFADIIADLKTYNSKTHGILLRHVLEHNYEWKQILTHALASADKVALIIFTPFTDTTKQIGLWWDKVPDLSFKKEDLTDLFTNWTEETFHSKTQFGTETIFYITT